jgi:three-Cys-motif partner protein
MKFIPLSSADKSVWVDPISPADGLPLRDSGCWIEDKHRVLSYFAEMFATGMKSKWSHRVYIELFAGPGRCHVRETGREEDGSPLRLIGHEFTRFIFIDISTCAARALEARLCHYPNCDNVEIWNGDCAEAIDNISIPKDALTFAFIDPTGIAHAPFDLVRKLRQKTRCDILINIQHSMGIKKNLHHYKPDADEDCALTRFLGDDSWKGFLGKQPREFFQLYLHSYREKLKSLGFVFSDNQVIVNMKKRIPLYLLLFASAHPRGQQFWNKAVKGSDPQLDFAGLL